MRKNVVVKRKFDEIKDGLQYAGIIAISCLAALWLIITGKRIM